MARTGTSMSPEFLAHPLVFPVIGVRLGLYTYARFFLNPILAVIFLVKVTQDHVLNRMGRHFFHSHYPILLVDEILMVDILSFFKSRSEFFTTRNFSFSVRP
jgi:hypothetical protein